MKSTVKPGVLRKLFVTYLQNTNYITSIKLKDFGNFKNCLLLFSA